MRGFAPWLIASLLIVGLQSQGSAGGKLPQRPKTPPENAVKLANSQNQFAFDLYAQVSQEPGNLVVSPYNLSVPLLLLAQGAAGETRREFEQTLHLEANQNLFQDLASLERVIRTDLKPTPQRLWTSATAFYVMPGAMLRPTYIRNCKLAANALFDSVNFSNPPSAAAVINDWVKRATKGMIPALVEPQTLDPSTSCMALNAVYFRAEWKDKFDPESTKDDPFFVTAEQSVQHPFMHDRKFCNTFDDDLYELLELPYVDETAAMVFILPKAKDGLPEVEKTLTAKVFLEQLKAAQKPKLQGPSFGGGGDRQPFVTIALPRFTIRKSTAFKPVLIEMGLRSPFQQQLANFANLALTNIPPFWLTRIEQRAVIEVDEVGTKAAAATGGLGGGMGGGAGKVTEFIADHPFLYFIVHRPTNCILFMGRVQDPTAM